MGELECVVPNGPAVIEVSGATVSTVKFLVAGDASVAPDLVARTEKDGRRRPRARSCAATRRPPTAAVDRHVKVDPDLLELKSKVGVESFVGPVGPAVIEVWGGVAVIRKRTCPTRPTLRAESRYRPGRRLGTRMVLRNLPLGPVRTRLRGLPPKTMTVRLRCANLRPDTPHPLAGTTLPAGRAQKRLCGARGGRCAVSPTPPRRPVRSPARARAPCLRPSPAVRSPASPR